MLYDPLSASGPGTGLDHPPSYWAATAGPQPEDDGALTGDHETEIAIIGGGYTGLSTAYHIARDLGAKPVVLEANRCGWGCSGRNGGFVRPSLGRLDYGRWIENWGLDGAQALFAECLSAVDLTREIVDAGKIDCDIQPAGGLEIAHLENRCAGLKAKQKLLKERFDFETELVDADSLALQHFRGQEAFAALREGSSFGLHPLKLAHGLHRLARGAGAVVHAASPVIGWTREGDKHLLQTPGGRLRADQVVIATNGYSTERLLKPLRARTLPVLSSIIVTRPMTAEEKAACNFVTSHVMIDTRKIRPYFRHLPDGRIMLGGRGSLGDAPDQQARQKDALLRIIKRKFPALHDITVDYFWGGWVNVSYDFMPHIHRCDDDRSVLYAMGYCGTGVATSILAGKRLAEVMGGNEAKIPLPLRGALPPYPLPAFRRLGQWAMVNWYRYLDSR
jgi:taurine dehydrogenase large subunit